MMNYEAGFRRVLELAEASDVIPYIISINGLPHTGKSTLRKDLCRHFIAINKVAWSATGEDSVINETLLNPEIGRIDYWVIENTGCHISVEETIKEQFNRGSNLRVLMLGKEKLVPGYINDAIRFADVVIENEFANSNGKFLYHR